MGLKTYLLTMSIATLLCWAAWVLIFFTVDPETTNQVGFGLFYSSLSLALIGTGAIIGFIVRFVFLKHDLVLRHVLDAFRQSFLFALLLVVSLILLSAKLFSWVNLFFLMAGLTILEYFLVTYRRSH
jgi:hypothetical protein